MKMKQTLLATAVLSMLSTTALAVDFGGYTRIGPGQKQADKCANGGGVVASATGSINMSGHGGIGRLGNECNTYGEFFLSQGMNVGGVQYKGLLMTNFFRDGSDANGITTKVQQMYIEGKGYDVAPNVTFWIGERFYHRADVHFDDTFYINMSGTGAGADGIDVGVGKLSVAAFRRGDDAATGAPGSRLNVDLEGIAVNPGGTLRLTGVFTKFSGTGGKNGTGLSLQHNQSGVFGGENTLWVQWSKGSASTNMNFGSATASSATKRWAIADSMAWTNGPLTGQALVQFGKGTADGALPGTTITAKSSSIGGRVAYALTKNFKVQGELGTNSTKPDGGSSQTVTKFTIAPTLTVGPNYYDRPELRFYVSTFSMNDAYRLANGYAKKTITSAGFQAELWF